MLNTKQQGELTQWQTTMAELDSDAAAALTATCAEKDIDATILQGYDSDLEEELERSGISFGIRRKVKAGVSVLHAFKSRLSSLLLKSRFLCINFRRQSGRNESVPAQTIHQTIQMHDARKSARRRRRKRRSARRRSARRRSARSRSTQKLKKATLVEWSLKSSRRVDAAEGATT